MKIQIRWCTLLLLLPLAASRVLGQTPNSLMADDSAADDDRGATPHDDAVANGISASIQGIAGDGIINNQYRAIRELLRSALGVETFTQVNQRQNVVQRYERGNTGALLVSQPKCMGSGGLAPRRIVVCGIVQGQNDCEAYLFGGNGPARNLQRVRQLLQKYAS